MFGKDYRDNANYLNASLGPVEWYSAALDGEQACPRLPRQPLLVQPMSKHA